MNLPNYQIDFTTKKTERPSEKKDAVWKRYERRHDDPLSLRISFQGRLEREADGELHLLLRVLACTFDLTNVPVIQTSVIRPAGFGSGPVRFAGIEVPVLIDENLRLDQMKDLGLELTPGARDRNAACQVRCRTRLT